MQAQPIPHRAMRAVGAAVAYFAVVFAAGFALGMIRVPLLVPRLGERVAELVEAPFMLLAIVLAARWVVRRFALPPDTPVRLGVGSMALVLLLAVEFSVVLWLRGLSVAEYVAQRDPVAGTVYAASLLLFALMPLLVRRR